MNIKRKRDGSIKKLKYSKLSGSKITYKLIPLIKKKKPSHLPVEYDCKDP